MNNTRNGERSLVNPLTVYIRRCAAAFNTPECFAVSTKRSPTAAAAWPNRNVRPYSCASHQPPATAANRMSATVCGWLADDGFGRASSVSTNILINITLSGDGRTLRRQRGYKPDVARRARVRSPT